MSRKETKFKQTEVGMIPEDWEVKTINEIADNYTGLTYSPENVRKYGIIVLRSSNIQNGKLCFDDNVFVKMDIPNRTVAKNGDILVCVRNGSKVLIGKSAIVKCGNEKMAFGAFMTVLRAKDCINNFFLLYAWQSDKLQKQVQESLGATINQITNSDFKRYYILFPPNKKEQTAIATALSDIDHLIESLGKLIAKKKRIKQGAMQQLLTGKKRLPGFGSKASPRSARNAKCAEPGFKQTELGTIPVDWEVKKLGQLCSLWGRIGFRGYTRNDLVDAHKGAITFSPSDIHDQKISFEKCSYISYKKYEESPEIKVFNGDIIFGKTASIGKCALIIGLVEKATINPQLVLFNNIKCENRFLYYQLIDKPFQVNIWTICGGSTIPTMSQEKLKQQYISLPSSIEEQTAIAQVLGEKMSQS